MSLVVLKNVDLEGISGGFGFDDVVDFGYDMRDRGADWADQNVDEPMLDASCGYAVPTVVSKLASWSAKRVGLGNTLGGVIGTVGAGLGSRLAKRVCPPAAHAVKQYLTYRHHHHHHH